jgi:hypothetical protein
MPWHLANGIILFDTTLTENADTYVPTEGNCLGHAGGSYAGSNPYRGNFNASESGAIANGYRQVWDFATNQCNGTIKAVALCTQEGGNQGYKNDFVGGTQLSSWLSPVAVSNLSKLLKVSADYKTVYYQQGSSDTVYLKRFATPNLAAITFLGSPKMAIDTSFAPSIAVPANTYLTLDFVGDTLYGLLYNYSTKALTLKTYDPTTLAELGTSVTLNNSNGYSISSSNNFGIIGNTIYVIGNSTLCKWSITDGSYLGSVAVSANYYVNTFDENNIALCTGYNVTLYNGTTFMGPVSENTYVSSYKRIPGTPLILSKIGSNDTINIGYMGTAFFTVNNLATPVPKTNSNTMKVTYDITNNQP